MKTRSIIEIHSIIALLLIGLSACHQWNPPFESDGDIDESHDADRHHSDTQVDSDALDGAPDADSDLDPRDAGWTKLDVEMPRLYSIAAAFDDIRNVTVVYGNHANGRYEKSDCGTWEWDGQEWTTRKPKSSPPCVFGHSMVFDKNRKVVVFYGGSTDREVYDETWLWDGNNWTLAISPENPSFRFHQGMAYDKARGRTVLFGGYIYESGVGYVERNDTWEWDGSVWSQVSTDGPEYRVFSPMVYHDSEGVVFLFGFGDDTWTWEGTTWTKRPSSNNPEIGKRALAYDVQRSRTVAYGTDVFSEDFDETYEWDGENWSSFALNPNPGPQWQDHPIVFVYDSYTEEILLFLTGEMWSYQGPL